MCGEAAATYTHTCKGKRLQGVAVHRLLPVVHAKGHSQVSAALISLKTLTSEKVPKQKKPV